jgi:cytochrome c oxidase subunit 1
VGGGGTGWTLYPPLRRESFGSTTVDISILSLHIVGIGSLIGRINFLSTLHNRVRGIQLATISVFCYSVSIIRFLLVFSLPVFAAAVTLLLLDRNLGTRFFFVEGGGDVLVFQHLFWFFGHPEVYILILPALGVVTHIMTWGRGVRVFYRRGSIVVAISGIGIIGCIV